MGKLIDHLEKQLKDPIHKKNAEDCIKIYNWIKETDPKGAVWASRWNALVDVTYKGFPSNERTYEPNVTGYAVLKGIKESEI